MGRSPCCEKVGLKKGPWTPEEDQKLLAYIQEHGHGSWRALPTKAGLQRCGKSCRLRWTNYLRPDIKRGKFSLQEEQTIIQLHALLGNRWSAIATHLPKRTDNEIKNYWNTHLKKRLTKMGIDPVTHKPKSATLTSINGQFKNEPNLSHMAQWESARLEAEARLVRESKLRSFQHHLLTGSSSSSSSAWAPLHEPPTPWQGMWSKSIKVNCDNLEESPTSTSTLTFSDQNSSMPILTVGLSNPTDSIEFMGNAGSSEGVLVKVEGQDEDQALKNYGKLNNFMRLENSSSMTFPSTIGLHEMVFQDDQEPGQWNTESSKNTVQNVPVMNNFIDRFTDLLLDHTSCDPHNDQNSPVLSDNNEGECTGENGYHEQEMNKDYWNNILHLVDSSPSDSPVF